MEKKYYIDYTWDTEDGEVSYTIYDQDENIVHTEDVLGDWSDETDVEMTGYEIARSHGFTPATYNMSALYGRRGGKKTAEKGTEYFATIGAKGGKKRKENIDKKTE